MALRLSYATSLPFPVLVLLAGVITGAIGILIGLPALRLSGLYLALITLMAAGAITVLLRIAQFPNGGDGFFGNSRGRRFDVALCPARRSPTADTGYYRYCVIVAALMFLLGLWHVRSKAGPGVGRHPPEPGHRRRRRRQHHAVQAVGLRAGVVHGRRRRRPCWPAASGGVNINQFPVQNSITLLAVVLMGGVYNLWGAVVSALFLRLLPALLDNWGVSTELLTILFGIGVLQVLLDRAGRHRRADAAGPGQPRPQDRRPRGAASRARGSGRHDRRRRPDRPLRRRHPARRDDAHARRAARAG